MRKFRANQSPYLELADSGQTVTITTRRGIYHLLSDELYRSLGKLSGRLDSQREETEDERIMRLNHLTAEELREIREGLEEAKAGLVTPIRDIHNIWADIL